MKALKRTLIILLIITSILLITKAEKSNIDFLSYYVETDNGFVYKDYIPKEGYEFDHIKCNEANHKKSEFVHPNAKIKEFNETGKCNIYFKKIGEESEEEYKITYDLFGGVANNPTTYKTTSEDITLNNPTKTGYTFIGWTGSNGNYAQKEVIIKKGSGGNKHYKANYEANNYSVKYDANGGKGTMENSNHTYDEKAPLEENTFTKDGYVFVGWSKDKDAEEPDYTNKERVENLTSSQNGTVTLYAVWKVKTYKVNVVVLNGTTTISSKDVTYNKNVNFDISPSNGYGEPVVTCTNDQIGSVTEDILEVKNVRNSTTCTVVYGIKTYNIDYDLNGGEVEELNPNNYNIHTPTFTLKNPTKEGYTFIGWTGSNGETPQIDLTINQGSTGNRTYKANYRANTYEVKYNANTGTGTMANSTHTYDIPSTLSKNTFTKTGHTFRGWSNDEKTDTLNYQDEESIKNLTSKDKDVIELYALWQIKSYKVNVNVINGTTPVGEMEIKYNTDATFTISPNPGYYNPTVSCTNEQNWSIKDGELVITKVNNDTTCTVTYKLETYNINYNLYGGLATNPTTYNVNTEDIALNNPIKTGYTFTGWTGSNGETPQKEVIIKKGTIGDKSYTANYNANKYTIKYDANGGVGNIEDTSYTYDEPKNLPKNTLTYEGRIFMGWSKDKNAIIPEYTDEENIQNLTATNNDNVILYAVWAMSNHTVNVTSINGTVSAPTSKVVDHNNDATFTVNPSTGYHYTKVECTNNQNASITGNTLTVSKVTSDTTCTVTHDANTYTISYNANGGTGTMNPSNHIYNTNKALSKNTFTKSGYNFAGWSTSSTSTTPQYTDEESVQNLTSTNNATVTLYAVWKKLYSITFDENGASGVEKPKLECAADEGKTCTVTAPNITPGSDFDVVGWSKDENSETAEIKVGDNITVSGDDTYYAITKSKNPYTITFKSNGATVAGTTSDVTRSCYRYNGKASCNITTPNATRTNYTVSGYNTSSTDTTVSIGLNATMTINSNATYYAISYRTYTATFYLNGATTIGGTSSSSTTRDCSIYNTETSCTVITPSISKSGWDIIGWGTSSSSTTSTNDTYDILTISGNVSRYAVTSKAINITYNANGGTGAPSTNTGTIYNTATSRSVTISSTRPSQSGKTFDGWGTSSYTSYASYYPSSTYTFTESTTLYAVWSEPSRWVTIKTSGHGSTYSTTTKLIPYGSSATFYTEPDSPTDRHEVNSSVSCSSGLSGSASSGYSLDTITIYNNSTSTSDAECTVSYKNLWTGVPDGSYSAGGQVTYSGKKWTVVSASNSSSSTVTLAYNGTFGSGTYSNAQAYIRDNFLNGTDVLGTDFKVSAVTNEGTNAGSSTANAPSTDHWVSSGYVKPGNKYTYSTNSTTYYAGHVMYKQSGTPTTSNYPKETVPTSVSSKAFTDTVSVSNNQTSYTCKKCDYTTSTNDPVSNYVTIFTPDTSYTSNAKQISCSMKSTYSGDTSSYGTTKQFKVKICGGIYAGDTATITAYDANSYNWYSPDSPSSSGEIFAISRKYKFIFASTASSTTTGTAGSNLVRTFDTVASSNCLKSERRYTVKDLEVKTIYYRPTITVRKCGFSIC